MKGGNIKTNYCRSRNLTICWHLNINITESDHQNLLLVSFKVPSSELKMSISLRKKCRITCSDCHIQRSVQQSEKLFIFLAIKGFTSAFLFKFSSYFLHPFSRWTEKQGFEIFLFYNLPRHLTNLCEDSSLTSLLLLHSSSELWLFVPCTLTV